VRDFYVTRAYKRTEEESVESRVGYDPNRGVPNVEEPLDSPKEKVAMVERGPELQVPVADKKSNRHSKDSEV